MHLAKPLLTFIVFLNFLGNFSNNLLLLDSNLLKPFIMTFEQAVERTQEYPPFTKNGLNYVFMVVPMIQEEIFKWSEDYLKFEEVFTNETAKRYSSNNLYAFLYIVKK
jgi:hypothetical protein